MSPTRGNPSPPEHAVNAGGANGLFFGNPAQMGPQIIAVIGTTVYAGVGSWIILKILDVTMGLRVSDEDEQMGLDLSQHNEAGYVM